jgi:SAM-dependent methyltransferase
MTADSSDLPASAAAYAAWARHYDAVEGDRAPYVGFYGALLGNDAASVMELGCGTGAVLVPMLVQWRDAHPGRGLAAVGVDASAPMLARARERDADVDWRLGDMRAPPGDEAFDLVFCCFNTLQLLPDLAALDAVFEGARARLARDGVFAFDLYRPNQAWLRMPRDDVPGREIVDAGGRRLQVRETTRFDDATRVLSLAWRLAPADDPACTVAATDYRIRQFESEEVDAALARNGLASIGRFGDLDRSPDAPSARKIVRVCRRA